MRSVFSFLIGLLLLTGISAGESHAQQPVRSINGGVVNGKATSLPKPEYPQALRDAGIEGMVVVNIVIDENGNVTSAEAELYDLRVKKNKDGSVAEQMVLDPQLRSAAVEAARAAKFAPTQLSGVPVTVKGKMVYNFSAATGSNSAGMPKTSMGGVLNGKATYFPKPEYPAAAKAVKAGGAVSVQLIVDEEGRVISAEAVSGHPLLRSAAETAAKGALFTPTFVSGQPVRISGILTYNFVP